MLSNLKFTRRNCLFSRRVFRLHYPQQHGFLTEAIEPVLRVASNAYIDLAMALPIPSSLPPYSTTIILLTLASRAIFSLPVAIWAKRRQWRAEEIVLPKIRSHAEYLQSLSQKGGHSGRNIQNELNSFRSQLLKDNKCHPIPTMLGPVAVQLPLFVVMSLTFREASLPPTPVDMESFFTIASLTYPDATATFPIITGLLSLAVIDSARWIVGEHPVASPQATSTFIGSRSHMIKIRPQNIAKQSLRMLSVLRIVVGMVMPGTVIIYWTASSTFSLIQAWVFDIWEARRISKRIGH